MKRLLLLSITVVLLSSLPTKASIPDKDHEACLSAKDYKGCIDSRKKSSVFLKLRDKNPFKTEKFIRETKNTI